MKNNICHLCREEFSDGELHVCDACTAVTGAFEAHRAMREHDSDTDFLKSCGITPDLSLE